MNQKIIAVVLALLSATALYYSTVEHKDAFQQWKQDFRMVFSQEEDAYRRIIFMKNLELIEKHNADHTQTYKMGLNQFSALTDAEFEATYLNPKSRTAARSEDTTVNAVIGDVDWVAQGKVSPVKNQGNCGSCWAFSAVAVLESWALFKSQTVNLSEQQLVDCSKSYGNDGCNGGFNYKGLAYVKDHGITSQSDYPYTAKTGSCRIQGGSFKIAGVTTVKTCANVQAAIQSHPLGVSADATNWSRYSSGIFNNCGRNLNHDILLVGYTSNYYTIKNSWGATWGEKGFIRLAPGNTCGVCDDPSPYVN
uniref:cathepsin L n=3 Tax=Noccaea caerulescens TaxID=107243 RepID=A0A1J3JDG4_NOCCA